MAGVEEEADLALEDQYADLDQATLAVRDLIAASQELTGRIAQLTGSNAKDMAAVGLLIQFGPMGAVELGRRLAIRSASATVLIDRLEQAGHAVRVRDDHDRRRVAVSATPTARHDNLTAWLPAIRAIDEVCSTLSETDRDTVTRFLERVTDATARSGREDRHHDAAPPPNAPTGQVDQRPAAAVGRSAS